MFPSHDRYGGERIDLNITVNGTIVRQIGYTETQTTGTLVMGVSGSAIIELQKGDLLRINVFQNSGASIISSGDGTENYLMINALPDFSVFGVNSIVGEAVIRDVKSTGTDGGTFTSGAWRTRDLNTLEKIGNIDVSLSSNQFILGPGMYRIKVTAPAFAVNRHQCKLRNVTDSDETIGSSSYADAANSVQNESSVEDILTLTEQKTFEIQHRAETTSSPNGFGVSCNFGVSEVYTTVYIEKVS